MDVWEASECEILGRDFYAGLVEPAQAAAALVGKFLWARDGETGEVCAMQILETEGYGPHDKACHASGYKKTARTATMFEAGGHGYIYKCYGMYDLFNVVCSVEGEPVVVLIRSGYPVLGLDCMLGRRKCKGGAISKLCRGPGVLGLALNIKKELNGVDLTIPRNLWLSEPLCLRSIRSLQTFTKLSKPSASTWLPLEEGFEWTLAASPRIGIASAGEDATLPWRFFVKEHAAVSTGPMVHPAPAASTDEGGESSPERVAAESLNAWSYSCQ